MTLDDLLLSCRADTALARLGCRTVDDVCRLTRSQIAAERNCARGSIAEIEAALRRVGRTLAEEVGAQKSTDRSQKQRDNACARVPHVLNSDVPGILPPRTSRRSTALRLGSAGKENA